MLISRSVDLRLWTEAVNTACYILNRVIMRPNESETPFEKWFKRKPNLNHLRIFGSTAYLNVPKEKRKKLDPKSKKMIIVGYDGESRNYRLWDSKSRQIFISSDVNFNERNIDSQPKDEDKEDAFFKIDFGPVGNIDLLQAEPDMDNDAENARDEAAIQEAEPGLNLNAAGQRGVMGDAAAGQQPAEQQPVEQLDNQRRELRDRTKINPPERYGIPVAFIADIVPMTYSEVMSSPEAKLWKAAIEEELSALAENPTWELVPLPPGKRVIGCKWVFFN